MAQNSNTANGRREKANARRKTADMKRERWCLPATKNGEGWPSAVSRFTKIVQRDHAILLQKMQKLNGNIDNLDPGLIKQVPAATALSYKIFPIARSGETIHLASGRTLAVREVEDLRFILGKDVVIESWPAESIERALKHSYQESAESPVETAEQFKVIEVVAADSVESDKAPGVDDTSVIDLVNRTISQAINQTASDIHIEPFENEIRVRYRIDGVLQCRETLTPKLKSSIISRVKIMADLDIAERRRPQDGRIRVTNGQRNIDIRVSTLPTDFGEKIVLRLLDKNALKLDLDKIGLADTDCEIIKRVTSAPYGMVLVTGPTGSGKTTTLYSTLNHLNRDGVNIVTIEDPIEYNLPGINQAHMRADIGFNFATALKTFLRQDPDIIMVGEIRDFETAEIALRAALTGHLVLSTLHTNDAASAVTRLIDMGVAPFLVASCVKLVVAQRLVRKICESCKREVAPDKAASSHLEIADLENISHLFEGAGCRQCHDTGYRGRTALVELLQIDDLLAQLIVQHKTPAELMRQATKGGMKTLRMSGMEKIEHGISTVAEVLRETRG